jgi:hypothetical protein
MKRLCIIGNSHIASLQDGWQAVRVAFSGVEPIFFGAPTRYMHALRRRDTALVPRSKQLAERYAMTSGGQTQIAGTYDAYVIYGLALSPLALAELTGRYRAMGYAADRRVLLSRRCHREAVRTVLEATWAGTVLRMLEQATRAPVLLLAAPMRSEEDPLHIAPLIECGDDRPLNESFLAGCRDVALRHRAQFLAQPAGTLGASPLTTRHVHSLAAAPSGKKRENDYIHMNGEYGALLLRHALPDLLSAC